MYITNNAKIIDWQKTDGHALNEEQRLYQQREQCVSNDDAKAGQQLRTSFAYFIRRIGDVLR